MKHVPASISDTQEKMSDHIKELKQDVSWLKCIFASELAKMHIC